MTLLNLKAIPDTLFMPAGALMIYWGMMEESLSASTAIIFQLAGGKHHEPRLQRNFSRRVKFLRLCLNKIDALAPFRKEGAALLDRIGPVAAMRDIIAHGSLTEGNEEGSRYVFSMVRPNATEDKHKLTTHVVEVMALHASARAALDIAHDFAGFSERLLKAFVTEKPSA